MANLGSHPNVWETCLQLLDRKGYAIIMRLDEEDLPTSWIAKRGEFSFAAENPIELLGLTTIYDELQPSESRPYWWTIGKRERNLVESMWEETIAWEERQLRWRERPAWQSRIREAWRSCEHDLRDTADLLGLPLRLARPLLSDIGLLPDSS